MALVFVLYAYGGWNDAVFVAAEVRDPQRNLPRALIFGLLGITGDLSCGECRLLGGVGV